MSYNLKPLSKHSPYEGGIIHHLFMEKQGGTLLSDIKIYIESDINDIAQFIRDYDYPLGFNEWFNKTKNVSLQDLEKLFLQCLGYYSFEVYNYSIIQAKIAMYGYANKIKIKFNKNINIKMVLISESDFAFTDENGDELPTDVYLLYSVDGEIDIQNIDKNKIRQEIYELVD